MTAPRPIPTRRTFETHMRLEVPAREYRAYLFDCDGTIVDSMPLHYVAWKKALGEWNCEFDEKLFYAWGGRPVKEIISSLNEMQGLRMPVDAVAKRKESLYFELQDQLKAIPEVIEHIEEKHGHIPLAVVSGSRRGSVLHSLSVLGLVEKFDVLVCAEDYARGKPAPDCFLTAAERLGVRPEDCLVFEDTDMGIEAATAAGMSWVRVPAPLERG